MAKKNLIVGQSGGPTAVINSSLYGVVSEGLSHPDTIEHVYGMVNGIEGFLNDCILDFEEALPGEDLNGLKSTPGAYLGSCRYKLPESLEDPVYPALFKKFEELNIGWFFYIGGNDSMDTCNKISKFMQQSGYECRVIGIPKTIDNDLYGTDHCPGFGSAAKFIATSCMEVHQDLRVYDKGRVTIVEIMGRHAGWLAGSAALATYAGAGPDLVYLPEVPFRMEEFWQDVDRIYKRNGSCMVAVSEGVQYADGRFVAESGDRDVFGHTQLGGLGAMLAESVKRQTGAKVRSIELSLLQRCASHVASKTDIDEAYMAGKAAVEAAVSGQTDKMVAFERSTENGIYSCKTKLTSLGDVANVEKLVPREWINTRGNGVEQPFIDYVLPLIQGETAMQKECSLPRFAKLKKVLADPVQG
jgi:6-phosphofructokinase 1